MLINKEKITKFFGHIILVIKRFVFLLGVAIFVAMIIVASIIVSMKAEETGNVFILVGDMGITILVLTLIWYGLEKWLYNISDDDYVEQTEKTSGSEDEQDKNQRFIEVSYESEEDLKVIMDTVTKLLYIRSCGEYGGGITPLLDEEGKPMKGDSYMVQNL